MNFGQYVRNGTAEHAKLAPYYAAVGCKLPNPQVFHTVQPCTESRCTLRVVLLQ